MATDLPDKLWLAELWQEHKERLLKLLTLRMPPVLLRRMSPEDLLQETYLACGARMSFLTAEPEVPVYVKLRRIALQTLTDRERYHLGAGKRDAMKENTPDADEQTDGAMDAWAGFADSISSPRSHIEKLERRAIIRRLLREMPETDREILQLRHFEEMSNRECAAALGIAEKAASIRYVRALKRFREALVGSGLFC